MIILVKEGTPILDDKTHIQSQLLLMITLIGGGGENQSDKKN
jgi:hypothetical protein